MKSDSAILDGKAMRLGSEPSRRLNAVRGLLLSGGSRRPRGSDHLQQHAKKLDLIGSYSCASLYLPNKPCVTVLTNDTTSIPFIPFLTPVIPLTRSI